MPNSATEPESAGIRPASVRTRVDLPEPFGPRSATVSPGAMARSMPCRMARPDRDTVRARASITGVAARAAPSVGAGIRAGAEAAVVGFGAVGFGTPFAGTPFADTRPLT